MGEGGAPEEIEIREIGADDRCKGKCLLFEPPEFWGLHPNAEYMEEAADAILERMRK